MLTNIRRNLFLHQSSVVSTQIDRITPSFVIKHQTRSTLRVRMSEAENSYIKVAIKAAKAAGAVISEALVRPKQIQHKGTVDLVTETDKECERLVLEIIRSHFPSHEFIGEENSSETGASIKLSESPTWMCDPLDGTTNFVHQYPSCCVSLALWINREPVVGVVYNPVLDELFTAEKGKGAFKNGDRIHVSDTQEMHKAIFATELGVVRDAQVIKSIFERISSLSLVTRSLRCGGSIALDLCNVACGRLDFCYEIKFGGCWDVAAGSLIVQEAGGRIFDPCGKPFHVLSRRILATNAHLDEEVLKITSKFQFYKDEPLPLAQ